MRKDFYDSFEVDNPELREGGLFGRLPNLIALALSGAGWARQLGGIDPNMRDLARGARACAGAARRRLAGAARRAIRRSAASSFRSAGARGAC